MNIFNSLGSNYSLEYVITSLFRKDVGSKNLLVTYLEKKYEGSAALTYKGRQAITMSLMSLNLPANSVVAINAFTCVAVLDGIKAAGHLPLLLDIERDTLNFSADNLLKSLEGHPIKVVIIQNTLGYPCEIEQILKICKEKKIFLLEDLAHSIGTVYKNGQEAGTVGDFVVLSFGQDKVVDSVSGGAVISRNIKYPLSVPKNKLNSTSLRDKSYPLLTYMIRKTYPVFLGKVIHGTSSILGLLSNPMKPGSQKSMSDWHAMLALKEFKLLEKHLAHKRAIAKIYCENLDKRVTISYIIKVKDSATHLRFPIFLDNREDLLKPLKAHKAYLSSIWYKNSIVSFSEISKDQTFKNSDFYMEKILNLPTHINTSGQDAFAICNIINDYIKTHDKNTKNN